MKKVLGFQYCIPFASRQIVNLLGVNGVRIMPGTSRNSETAFFIKCFGVFLYGEFPSSIIKD